MLFKAALAFMLVNQRMPTLTVCLLYLLYNPSFHFSVESSQLLGSDSGSLSKPLYTHESSAAEALAEPEEQSAKKQRWLLVYSILAVVAYLSVGVVTFTTMSGMRPLDALYFSVGEPHTLP